MDSQTKRDVLPKVRRGVRGFYELLAVAPLARKAPPISERSVTGPAGWLVLISVVIVGYAILSYVLVTG
jgi:hypothetical protein